MQHGADSLAEDYMLALAGMEHRIFCAAVGLFSSVNKKIGSGRQVRRSPLLLMQPDAAAFWLINTLSQSGKHGAHATGC